MSNKQNICPHCGTHLRQVLDLQIRIEQQEDAIKNLLEKIEQLEHLEDFDGLDAQILE